MTALLLGVAAAILSFTVSYRYVMRLAERFMRDLTVDASAEYLRGRQDGIEQGIATVRRELNYSVMAEVETILKERNDG